MPQKVKDNRSDLSVSIGRNLRGQLNAASREDERSLSDVTKEALKHWLAARERKKQRERQSKEKH